MDPASDPEIVQTSPRWLGHKERQVEREKQGERWMGRTKHRAAHPQMLTRHPEKAGKETGDSRWISQRPRDREW